MNDKSVDKASRKGRLMPSMPNQAPPDGRTYAVLSHERGVRLNDATETSQKIPKNHGSRPIARVDREDNHDFIVEQVRKLKLKPAKVA